MIIVLVASMVVMIGQLVYIYMFRQKFERERNNSEELINYLDPTEEMRRWKKRAPQHNQIVWLKSEVEALQRKVVDIESKLANYK